MCGYCHSLRLCLSHIFPVINAAVDMSASYLAAVATRSIDAAAEQIVPVWDENFMPADPANEWRGGIIEVESFFKATSTAVGSQAIAMSDDGDTFFIRAYEGDDEKVGVYSVKSGPLRSFAAHTDVISALSLDGDRLASASTDGTARLWEVSSGTCFARADVGEVLRSVHLAGNFLVTGDAGNKATMWRLGSGDDASGRTWKGYRRNDDDRNEDDIIAVEVALPRLASVAHRGTVYGVGVTSGGVACSIGWNCNDLKVWSSSGTVLHEVATPSMAGFALALQGDSVFVGLRSGHVATYSISTGAMGQIFAANSARREVSALAVAGKQGGKQLVVTGCEYGPQAIRLMSLEGVSSDEGKQSKPELISMHDPMHAVAAIALSRDCRTILTSGPDEELEAWGPAAPYAVAPPARVAPWLVAARPCTRLSPSGRDRHHLLLTALAL